MFTDGALPVSLLGYLLFTLMGPIAAIPTCEFAPSRDPTVDEQ